MKKSLILFIAILISLSCILISCDEKNTEVSILDNTEVNTGEKTKESEQLTTSKYAESEDAVSTSENNSTSASNDGYSKNY